MASLLTEALKNVEMRTDAITGLSNELVRLDVQLQDAHYKAKQDPDEGEAVLQLYVAFLAKRDDLIAELQREQISVPWQLRMKIDEFEQSLKERKAMPYAKGAKKRELRKVEELQKQATASPETMAPQWERKDSFSIVLPLVLALGTLIVAYIMRTPIFGGEDRGL
ncbi:hypothetical protein ACHHYP_08499 [Achlya hypogyna]|uniref:Uncharacterized protein n=1 Tax=Achlya hypogyna TaxID=1202772 RepID=A0A1V9YPC4_ACHHY|nr:hypothetical protein ACHHYP_08499 [Achlya hypogyna]